MEDRELEDFCRRLLRRPELEELFGHYSGEDCVLSAEELRDFLQDQGEEGTLHQACAIICAHELNEKGRDGDVPAGGWVAEGQNGCHGDVGLRFCRAGRSVPLPRCPPHPSMEVALPYFGHGHEGWDGHQGTSLCPIAIPRVNVALPWGSRLGAVTPVSL